MIDRVEQDFHELEVLYHCRGKERQAIEAYRAFLSQHDSYGKAWINLGILLYQAGDVYESLQCYQKVIKLNPALVDGWRLKAMVLGDLNRSQNPAYSQLQHLRDTYKQMYSSLKALRKDLLICYDQILKLDGQADAYEHQLMLKQKAIILEQLDKPKEALAIYMELLQTETIEQQRYRIQYAISRQYEAMKKWNQAIEVLNPMIADGEYQLLLDKARILTRMKKKKEAEDLLEQFLEKADQKYDETRDVTYIFQKASGYEQMGEVQKGIDTLDWLLNSGIKMSLRQTAEAKDRILRLKKNL